METERTSPDSANSAEQDQSGEFAAESAPGIDSQNKKPSHTRINLAYVLFCSRIMSCRGFRERDLQLTAGMAGQRCLKCRSRRARCSGERPTCASCARTASICVWPDGRKVRHKLSRNAQAHICLCLEETNESRDARS